MSKETDTTLIDAVFALTMVAALSIVCAASYYSLEILSGVDTSSSYINIEIGESVTYCIHALKVCIVF